MRTINKKFLALTVALCLLISTVTLLVANVGSTLATVSDPVREAYYDYIESELECDRLRIADVGTFDFPFTDDSVNRGVASVLFADLDGDGVEEMIAINSRPYIRENNNITPWSWREMDGYNCYFSGEDYIMYADVYRLEEFSRVTYYRVDRDYGINQGLSCYYDAEENVSLTEQQGMRCFLLEQGGKRYFGFEMVWKQKEHNIDGYILRLTEFEDGTVTTTLSLDVVRNLLQDKEEVVISLETASKWERHTFNYAADSSYYRTTEFPSFNEVYSTPSYYASFNEAFNDRAKDFGFDTSWLTTVTKNGYTYSSLWDSLIANNWPSQQFSGTVSEITSLTLDVDAGKITLTDHTNWQENQPDAPVDPPPPPATDYRAVKGYKNLYEVLDGSGNSKEPKQYIWSDTAPTNGSAPPNGSCPAYVKSGTFYIEFIEDSGIFLAVRADGTGDFNNAIWWGPDMEFNTSDDFATTVKEESGQYFWQQEPGVWQLIPGVYPHAPSATPGVYTIFYGANGGVNAPALQNVTFPDPDVAKTVALSSIVPTRVGYKFLGWYLYGEQWRYGGGLMGQDSPYEDGKPLYQPGDSFICDPSGTSGYVWEFQAIWQEDTVTPHQPGEYTITYDANGGVNAPTQQNVAFPDPGVAKTVTLSNTVPTRVGYKFLGWHLCGEAWPYGGGGVEGSVIPYEDGKPLYQPGDSFACDPHGAPWYTWRLQAIWEDDNRQAVFQLFYDANGGVFPYTTQNKMVGKPLTLYSDVPTRDGYTFLGWATSADATTAQYLPGGTLTDDISKTLYAVWVPNTPQAEPGVYAILYDINGGTGAPANQSVSLDASPRTLKLSTTKPAREGYTFLGWALSKTSTFTQYQPGDTVTVNADMTLYAVWQKNSTFVDSSKTDDDNTSSTEPSGNKVALTDTATDVVVSAEAGRLPEGTKLTVRKVQGDAYAGLFGQGAYMYLYDITLTKDGKQIQPTGSVTVKIPLPADYAIRNYGLYYVDISNNHYQQITPQIEGSNAVFPTDHFSVYGFASNGTDDGVETNGTASLSGQGSNSFFNPDGSNSGQAAMPKTGVGIDGKIVALIIVILLDVVFMAWLVLQGKKKQWPKLMRPTLSLQLPEFE